MGRRMQPRNEKFLTLFSKAGSNVVESAAILMEFVAAPHERWAELAKRMHDTEHAGDDTTMSLSPLRSLGAPCRWHGAWPGRWQTLPCSRRTGTGRKCSR
jgi:hypothetical protein